MDVDAAKTGRGIQHSEAKKNKLMTNNQCFIVKFEDTMPRIVARNKQTAAIMKVGPIIVLAGVDLLTILAKANLLPIALHLLYQT